MPVPFYRVLTNRPRFKRLRVRGFLSKLSFQFVQRLRKSLGKRVNKVTRVVDTKKLSFNTRKILRNSLPYISRRFLIFCVFVQSALLCIQFVISFPRFSEISAHAHNVLDRGVVVDLDLKKNIVVLCN